MKNYSMICFLLFAFVPLLLPAQPTDREVYATLSDSSKSVVFGYDIFINDQPGQNQTSVALCSAFNGWLFSAYGYYTQTGAFLDIYRSTDNGISWNIFQSGIIGGLNTVFPKIELIASGNTMENLRLITGLVYSNVISGSSYAMVMVHNGVTGEGMGDLFDDMSHHIHDLTLATDYLYPALGTNPNSIGLLYTKTEYGTDSLVFRSSSNGGLSFDNRKIVVTSQKYLHKVDLAYGYSPGFSSGRYFAVWEEQEAEGSNLGHIYTAHSDPNYNSPFTTPVCLDSLDVSTIDQCRNPVIACQQSDMDNDSINITQIVLFEKYDPSSQQYDITGCYNLRAATGTFFTPLEVAASGNDEQQPDIAFNPFDSTFMVTYFDKNDQKLPFITNNYNLDDPGNWNVDSPGYNDSSNLANPYPRLTLNVDRQAGAVVWRAERNSGNGAAMFDAVYIYYTGVSEHNRSASATLFGAYPNPCSTFVAIAFELKSSENVTMELYNLTGQLLEILMAQQYPEGRHKVTPDITHLPVGNYLYTFRAGDFSSYGKLVVIK